MPALEPYLTLSCLGTPTKRRDERVNRVRNAARLLASLKSDDDTPSTAPSRLLSAHAFHGAFTPDQITTVVGLVNAHVAEHGWLTKRHSSHPTTDFSLHDAPHIWAVCEPIVSRIVLPTLHAMFFGAGETGAAIAINDLFYVRYDADTDGAQRELEAHRDGSLLSFSVAMTSPDEFEGGGTRFVGADRVMRPGAAGDLVAHSGKVLHAGEAVTAGVRDILVGFITVSGPAINENFLESKMVTAAHEHPRLDAAIVNGAVVATAL